MAQTVPVIILSLFLHHSCYLYTVPWHAEHGMLDGRILMWEACSDMLNYCHGAIWSAAILHMQDAEAELQAQCHE